MLPATNSDSEDDLDYVPPPDDDSSDDHSEPDPAAGSEPPPLKDPAEQKRRRDALWATFQASVATSSDGGGEDARPAEAKVRIAKTYLFAGKYVTEVVEVPEGSDEANRWPRVRDSSLGRSEEGESVVGDVDLGGGEGAPPPPATARAAPTAGTSALGATRPGPRKPRTALPSIPKASHAKKITTLDKSAMDWRTHVASQSSDVMDELNANRRGGGYLEKVEFLKRVEDRREDAFEASRASKRRKT